MPPEQAEAAQTESVAIKALRFISSIGYYGMIVGPIQAAYGVYQWDKVPVLIGVCGTVLSFGWKTFWDWVIVKAAPQGAADEPKMTGA